MKRSIAFILYCLLLLGLCACAGKSSGTIEPQDTEAPGQTTDAPDTAEPSATEQPENGSGVLVVFFSRTGEQYSVGVIEKGNTAIVAEMIAEKTGADMFEILPETDYYPYTYNELTDIAKKEQSENARPAIRGELPYLSQYDTIFIGAPVRSEEAHV